MLVIISFVIVVGIAFSILVVFLNKVLNRDVGAATAHLDQLAGEYAKREDEIKKQLEDVKRQSQEIIINAQKDTEQHKQRMLKDIEEQKQKIFNDAQAKCDEMMQQADRARLALIGEVTQRIDERAIQKAKDLLQDALPEDIKLSIHQKWIDDLIASTFEQLDRLRIPEGISEVSVVTAFSLTEEERQALHAKLKEKIGIQINLKEELDPSIISGWIVTIGSLILDGSLRFKIQEAAISQQKANIS